MRPCGDSTYYFCSTVIRCIRTDNIQLILRNAGLWNRMGVHRVQEPILLTRQGLSHCNQMLGGGEELFIFCHLI